MQPFFPEKPRLAIVLASIIFAASIGFAQNTQPAQVDVSVVPNITVQSEDYAEARKNFHTALLRKGPAPHQQDCQTSAPPAGVEEVYFSSGNLRLRAWLSRPSLGSQKYPVVLFLHGGFCFDATDWEQTKQFRDAGFIVMLPNRRGENGLPGNFTMFYDEVDDVIAAAEYLRQQSFVDQKRIYVAGLSTGGTLTMLAALAYPRFRAAASFSGSPDLSGYTQHAVLIGNEGDIPFDYRNARELELRSAWAYAAGFKCPARLYYGTEETHFALSTQPTAALAGKHSLDVQAIAVPGGHTSAEDEEIRRAIAFFQAEK